MPLPTLPAPRRSPWVRRVVSTGFAAVLALSTASAQAEESWRAEKGDVHGSQVASSEWLPIFLGAGAGVVAGGLVGNAFDSGSPPVVGALVGGGIGGITGGAAGAWLIRSAREKDTRLAGAITGLGLGAGVGAILFAKMEPNDRALETVGKWSAVVVLPVIGAVVGRHLAIELGSTQSKEAPPAPAPVAIAPHVAPVVASGGVAGFSFGLDGAF